MLRVPRAPQSNGHCRTKLSSSVWKENAEPAPPRALAVLFHISEDIPGPPRSTDQITVSPVQQALLPPRAQASGARLPSRSTTPIIGTGLDLVPFLGVFFVFFGEGWVGCERVWRVGG